MKIHGSTKILGLIAMATLTFTNAQAETFSQSASVTFLAPISVVENTQMSFGNVETGATSGQTLILSTAGAITGTASANYLDSGAAGDFSVTADGSTISIAVNVTGADTVTLSDPTCSYDGAASTACSSAITGLAADGGTKQLLVGGTLTLSGSEASGQTYSPTFDIVVNYE